MQKTNISKHQITYIVCVHVRIDMRVIKSIMLFYFTVAHNIYALVQVLFFQLVYSIAENMI